MGIPRLLGYLEPYASTVKFKSTDNYGAAAGGAVVDGPALAYHVFRDASARRRTVKSTGRDALSYEEIGDAVLQWLSALEAHTVHIAAIYFDGALPDHKQDERLLRLQQHVEALRASKLRAKTSQSRPELPPPFLVAAVIEALISSRFRDRVHIVNGEADPYCAALARERGGVILTGDSDLVLYDLGTNGSVVYLDQVQTQLAHSSTPFQATGYHPVEIAKSLRLRTLLALGFEIKRDPTRSFNASVSAARTNLLNSPEYEYFAKQYTVHPPELTGLTHLHCRLRHEFKDSVNVLDPRVSEFIVASHQVREHESELNMYLPPLNDDPDRSAAWSVGKPIRLLAYSILLSGTAHGLVKEFSRRGLRVAADPLHVLTQSNIISSIESLLDAWNNFETTFAIKSIDDLWRLFGLYTLCTHSLEQGKPAPDAHESTRLLRGETPGRDWARIHLHAEFEAAIYSIRILQQCSFVFLGLRPEGEEDSPLAGAVRMMHVHLGGQPRLAKLFPHPQDSQTAGGCTNAVHTMYELLQIESKSTETLEPFSGSKKRKKRKGKKRTLNSGPASLPKSSSQPNNMYSLLIDGI